MKKSKALAALITLGLTTAAVTPALALENEFHGLFSARYINSNFNQVNGNNFGEYDFGPTKKRYSANFVEQRARLQYIAKANADLKLVTHFELDYAYWGNSSYGFEAGTGTPKTRNGGGALGADTVNFETKSIYLDANPFKNINMKLGMMPNNDAFKGILFDADMAGALISSNYGNSSPSFGVFRFASNPGNGGIGGVLGQNTSDMIMLNGKFAVSKDLKVGGAYYFFRDNSDFAGPNTDVKMNVLGVNGEFTTGPLTLNGFAVVEAGTVDTRSTTAWALNTGAKLKVGPGTARGEFLYISGEDKTTGHSNAFYAVTGQANGEHGYYDNEMVILGRDKNAYTSDTAIIFNSNNKNQGTVGGYIGYDLPINAKLTTAFNAGFAAVAKDNASKPINQKAGAANKSNYLGTEINAEATYQLLDGLTTSVRTAYVVLGDYYKDTALNGTPENPYDFKLIFKYTF